MNVKDVKENYQMLTWKLNLMDRLYHCQKIQLISIVMQVIVWFPITI